MIKQCRFKLSDEITKIPLRVLVSSSSLLIIWKNAVTMLEVFMLFVDSNSIGRSFRILSPENGIKRNKVMIQIWKPLYFFLTPLTEDEMKNLVPKQCIKYSYILIQMRIYEFVMLDGKLKSQRWWNTAEFKRKCCW